MGDTFGKIFRVTTWGESHGVAVGVVIEGCPPLLKLNLREEKLILSKGKNKISVPVLTCSEVQKELDRRRPGQSKITTSRKETDTAYFLSGLFEGKTTGTPICALAWNGDVQSRDYEVFKMTDRPGHAGFTYRNKYGIYDYRGGGRSSYRETWGRVVAGAIAKKILREQCGIEILAYVSQIGSVTAAVSPEKVIFNQIESNPVRCPDPFAAREMELSIEQAMKEGDSLGGMIHVIARNVPIGLGEPVFDKLDADLFKALKSIHATKSVEIGLGSEVAGLHGSANNDLFFRDKKGAVHPKTNKAGGVLGGISTGEPLFLKVAFKPTATIAKVQNTVTIKGKKILLKGVGRHDPCVVPRAVPTVEAMVALVLTDHLLRHRAQCGIR